MRIGLLLPCLLACGLHAGTIDVPRAMLPAGPGGAAGGVEGTAICAAGVGCQFPDQLGHGSGGVVAATSDLNPAAGFTVAENLRVFETGSITTVCWWGIYVDFVNLLDCAPGTGDSFTITYYSDNAGGLVPGTLYAGPFAVGLSGKFSTGNLVSTAIGPIAEWQFEAIHPPVTVTAGQCLWIEITNATTGNCFWLWQTAPPGDGRAAQDAELDGYEDDDATDWDLAFCVNVATGPGGCGLPGKCFDQLPADKGGFPSDIDCDACDGIQVIAENFVLTAPESIDSVIVHGFYSDDMPPDFDRFTVIFWDDAGGLPGGIIVKLPLTPSEREFVGGPFGDRYRHTIPLEPNVELGAGTYWVEVYNDTQDCPWDCQFSGPDGNVGINDFLDLIIQWTLFGSCDINGGGVGIVDFLSLLVHWGPCPLSGGDWAWELGVLDPGHGVPGSAFAVVRDNAEAWLPIPEAELALNLVCKPNTLPCPGGGDCCVPNGTPACDNEKCCTSVCGIDPFCCDVEWDSICADEATGFPACGCDAGVCDDPGKTPEGEPNCGLGKTGEPDDFVDGGCNSVPPVFLPLTCGQSYCGSAASNGLFRDTDWYEVVLKEPTALTWTVTAEFDVAIGLVQYTAGLEGSGNCLDITGALDPFATAPAGKTASVTTPCLAPGTWWLFVAPESPSLVIECGAEYNAALTCASCPVCGALGAGDCCFSNGTPGCENQECCERVCAADPFCCDVTWDGLCASATLSFPQCGCLAGER